MKPLAKVLAFILAYAIGVQPVVAQVQSVRVQTGGVHAGAVGSSAAVPQYRMGPNSLTPQQLNITLSGTALPSVGGVHLAPAVLPVAAAAAAHDAALPATAASPILPVESLPVLAPSALTPIRPIPRASPAEGQAETAAPAEDASVESRLAGTVEAVEIAGEGIETAKTDEAGSRAVAGQFDALIGARSSQAGPSEEHGAPVTEEAPGSAVRSGLLGPQALDLQKAKTEAADEEAAAEKLPLTKVFKDPERNRSFWRYVLGYGVFLFGFQMYMVGLPYLISSFTKNGLKENNDARLESAEALKALVRQNRSLSRVAHWTAQAFSYISIPLFTKKNPNNPKKWLVRGMLIRSATLAAVVGLFFASGLFSLNTALIILLGFIAAQSFFQGLSITMESAASMRVFGDKSVTGAERRKANSIMAVMSGIISIIGPAIAGHISTIKDFFGKTGVGGVVVYGIYAATVGIAALIFATIRMFGDKEADAKAAAEARAREGGVQLQAEEKGPGILKGLWVSLKDGLKMIMKNRFLRTMLGITLVSYLFSDPLIFNVLPEFASNLISSNAGLSAVMGWPVIGWFLKGLTSTPMGYFALMAVMASTGSIVASLLTKPMTKLFKRLGFKTEESLTIPFYLIAALEVPLFWLMIFSPSVLAVVGLYGLQAFVLGFAGIAVSGVNQKVMGSYKKGDLPKILAAQSFVTILAAIASTLVYGFVLTDIPIATSLLIAAVATTVLGVLRVAMPWLAFTKEQRKGEGDVGTDQAKPEERAK